MRHTSAAQTLVEFALVLPIFLFLMLGFGESAFLFSFQHAAQNSADVLAQSAAQRISDEPPTWEDDWQVLIAEEEERIGCESGTVDVTFPDETMLPGDRVLVGLSCLYQPTITRGLWAGIRVSVESEAVIPPKSPPTSSSATPRHTGRLRIGALGASDWRNG